MVSVITRRSKTVEDARLIADRYGRQIANLQSSICNLKSFVPSLAARSSSFRTRPIEDHVNSVR